MNINENIKNFRIFRGIKQQDLADQLKKSKSVISNWERGENSPDVESCETLCKIFKVTPNQLFGWEANQEYEEWKKQITENNNRIEALKNKIATMEKEVQNLENEQAKLKAADDTEPAEPEHIMTAQEKLRKIKELRKSNDTARYRGPHPDDL